MPCFSFEDHVTGLALYKQARFHPLRDEDEEAADVLAEIVGVFRALVESGSRSFRNELASALSWQATYLEKVPQPSDALEAVDEAVGRYRELVEEADSKADRIGLACSLRLRAAMVSFYYGREGDALNDITQVITLLRRLIEDDPESTGFHRERGPEPTGSISRSVVRGIPARNRRRRGLRGRCRVSRGGRRLRSGVVGSVVRGGPLARRGPGTGCRRAPRTRSADRIGA
ncbi:hypothetical protein AB0L53_54990, partial [Nonomuraea sp. NPDC052129]|uniref:hypothetical protein n=1 Tax=Nonomuraea sp. NPDC052129 TaxID=3154651 RepID=UPI00341FBD47